MTMKGIFKNSIFENRKERTSGERRKIDGDNEQYQCISKVILKKVFWLIM